jgi:hypothetical protein
MKSNDRSTQRVKKHARNLHVQLSCQILCYSEHRDELNAAIKESLSRLDGSKAAAVSVLTGMSAADLEELGGLPA